MLGAIHKHWVKACRADQSSGRSEWCRFLREDSRELGISI